MPEGGERQERGCRLPRAWRSEYHGVLFQKRHDGSGSKNPLLRTGSASRRDCAGALEVKDLAPSVLQMRKLGPKPRELVCPGRVAGAQSQEVLPHTRDPARDPRQHLPFSWDLQAQSRVGWGA